MMPNLMSTLLLTLIKELGSLLCQPISAQLIDRDSLASSLLLIIEIDEEHILSRKLDHLLGNRAAFDVLEQDAHREIQRLHHIETFRSA